MSVHYIYAQLCLLFMAYASLHSTQTWQRDYFEIVDMKTMSDGYIFSPEKMRIDEGEYM